MGPAVKSVKMPADDGFGGVAGATVGVERLADLLARLHARPRRRLTLLVAVDSPGGSGKSTLVSALARLDPQIVRVEMDTFSLPVDRRRQQSGELDAGAVAADVDWRRLRSQVLLPLARNEPARYQCYDWDADALAEWRPVAAGGIVMVEGVYSCIRQLATFYDFRIWVEAPADLRLRRGQERDRENGRAPLWEAVWMRAEAAYIALQDPAAAAALVVDGSGQVEHDPATEYVRVRP